MKIGERVRTDKVFSGLRIAKTYILDTITRTLHDNYLDARQDLGIQNRDINISVEFYETRRNT